MIDCPNCGITISRKGDLKRHIERYCYKKESTPQLIKPSKLPIKLRNINQGPIRILADADLLKENQMLRERLIHLQTVASRPSNVIASVTGDNNTTTLGETNVNITIINKIDSEGDGNFHSKCLNLFEYVLNECDGNRSRAISKIRNIFRKKRTAKNKYDLPELEKLFPPEKFKGLLKRVGKDPNGDYQYSYKKNNKMEICGTDHIDKVLGTIISDAGLLTFNAAIQDSRNSHEKSGTGEEDDGNGGVARHLSTNYGDIYGKPGDDLISKVNSFRNLQSDPKHLDHTVSRITL
jgi:hypothetical protein